MLDQRGWNPVLRVNHRRVSNRQDILIDNDRYLNSPDLAALLGGGEAALGKIEKGTVLRNKCI